MKINPNEPKIIRNTIKQVIEKENMPEISAENIKQVGGDISANYLHAIQNVKNKVKDCVAEAESIITGFIEKDEHIGYSHLNQEENVVRLNIRKEIEGFKGLYKDDKRACCYFDDKGNISQVFMKNNKTGEVDIFNLADNSSIHYSKEEVDALFYYKYHPESIHSKLRFGKDKFSGSFKEETDNVIKILDRIFSDETKLSKSTEKKTLYRALESGLSAEDLLKLRTKGAVFTEKSYCSTTTDLNTAKRFAQENPIIEIEYPANEGFVDIEKIFNVDRKHFNEQECFLKKGCSFEVTGFDKENNIIRVKYL